MDDELYEWLKREYVYSNIKKYYKSFKQWISNITEHQIEGFRQQMVRQKQNILNCNRWEIISKIDLTKYNDI